MEYCFYTEPVTFVIIKNFYELDDVHDIHLELDTLRRSLGGPETTGTALNSTGVPRKDNHGLFLDDFYQGLREKSSILTINRKVFAPEVRYELSKGHWLFKYLDRAVHDSTLVSYYRQGDYYKAHEDKSFLTAIYYTWKEPKSFQGGELYFGDFKVPIENNSLLIFPSLTRHCVTEVTSGEGRWALSQFITLDKPPLKMPEIDQYFNFLDVSEFSKISIQNSNNWKYGGYSVEGGNRFWFLDLMDDPFYSKYLKEKIERTVGGQLVLDRVYANGQTFGQDGQFHQDSTGPKSFTFLLYTNLIEGDIDMWGGETQFRLPKFLRSYQPIPNSAIFFNSNLFHRGLGPSRHVKDMRITIAWKFRVSAPAP